MKKEKNCKHCNNKITLGKRLGERRFWDNSWDYYDCGSIEFRPAEDWLNVSYTCRDCNNDPWKGHLPLQES